MISLGANTLGIGIAIRLHNQFSAQAAAVNASFNSMHGNAQRVIADNLRAARGIGIGMMAAGAAGLKFMGASTVIAANFDFQMRSIQAATSATTEQMKLAKAISIELGTETVYTAQEVGSAIEYMVRSGLKLPQAFDAIRGVVNLGSAAGGQAIGGKGGIADTMMAILHEFNLAASSSTRLGNVLAKAANISSSDIGDIAQAMKYTGGNAKTLNISLEETAGMLAVLSNAGLKGGVAGRSLNNMLGYMANAVGMFRTNRQTDAFKAIGLGIHDIVDSTGELRPMTEILARFGKGLDKMSNPDKVSALTALFNMRGSRAMIPLLEKSIKIGYNFADTLKELQNVPSNYAQGISDIIMGGNKGDFEKMKDSWWAFKEFVGSELAPLMGSLARGITRIINGMIKFGNTPFGKPLVYIAAGLSVALAVGGALLVVFTSIKLLTLASTVSMAAMGKTLTWAWTSSAAAAARYAAVAQGVTWMGPNGVYTAKGMKGFQSAGKAAQAGSAATAGKGLLGFLRNLSWASKGLNILGNIAKGAVGAAGFVVTVIGALMGFKNMIKMIIYGLGTFFQAIMFVVDYVANIGEGPIDAFNIARDKFTKRNDALRKMYIGTQDDKDVAFRTDKTVNGKQMINVPDIKPLLNPKPRPIILNLDGKKVGDGALLSREEDLKLKLGSTIH